MNVLIMVIGLFVIFFSAVCHKLWNMALHIFESTIKLDEFSVVNVALIILGILVTFVGFRI